MPRAERSMPSPLSAVSTVRNFVDVMKELSFDDERKQAERQPHLLILTAEPETGQRIAEALTGLAQSPAIVVGGLDVGQRDIDQYDVVIVHDPMSTASFDKARRRSSKGGLHVIDLPSLAGDDLWAEPLRLQIARALPDLAPALGRWYPPFRKAAVRAVIDETSRVNAQFALISNAPAMIPVIGGLASAGADFIVLTKNQLMLIFKLAAIHGRDLRDQWALMREMMPVVGAGLVWRTIAREAASFLPFAAGTIPKVAIAYSGTFAAGWAADFYYQFGKKPTAEEWRKYAQLATEALRKVQIGRSNGSADALGEIIDITPRVPNPENA